MITEIHREIASRLGMDLGADVDDIVRMYRDEWTLCFQRQRMWLQFHVLEYENAPPMLTENSYKYYENDTSHSVRNIVDAIRYVMDNPWALVFEKTTTARLNYASQRFAMEPSLKTYAAILRYCETPNAFRTLLENMKLWNIHLERLHNSVIAAKQLA